MAATEASNPGATSGAAAMLRFCNSERIICQLLRKTVEKAPTRDVFTAPDGDDQTKYPEHPSAT